MTFMDVTFRYGRPPAESEMRALKEVREVYGVWRVTFDEVHRLVSVEYDASRLSAADVAALLRQAGFDIAEQVPAIPAARPLAA